MDVVELSDSRYPMRLKEIKNPPGRLYFKGSWDAGIFANCLGVVGSRRMSEYGEKVTKMLVSELAAAGITIVSGFMYGIDASAHAAALDAGGKTIAVMPCGIDLIIPEYQEEMYGRICSGGGLVVSEYEGTVAPQKYTFLERNRIVAGLSSAVLIVEAALNSGSLVTASLAKEYGRKVFAVPGNITSAVSGGTLGLIKQGAQMATSAGDIGEYFGINLVNRVVGDLDVDSQLVYELLGSEPQYIEQISIRTGISTEDLTNILSKLEISGLISNEFGQFYAC